MPRPTIKRVHETSQMLAASIVPSARTRSTLAVKKAAESSIRTTARRWRGLMDMERIKKPRQLPARSSNDNLYAPILEGVYGRFAYGEGGFLDRLAHRRVRVDRAAEVLDAAAVF